MALIAKKLSNTEIKMKHPDYILSYKRLGKTPTAPLKYIVILSHYNIDRRNQCLIIKGLELL